MNTEAAHTIDLIIAPHGGPHSHFSASFTPLIYAYLCLSGYHVLLVNYRGSTGFGQRGVTCLLGRIGELDVADTHVSILYSCYYI